MKMRAAVAAASAALAAVGMSAADSRAQWRTEPIPTDGTVSDPVSVQFDARGRGLLATETFARGRGRFTDLALRDPDGGWRSAPDLAGRPVHVGFFAGTRALLLARRFGPFSGGSFRLLYAYGRSDGSFGPPQRLAELRGLPVAAHNRSGEAIVAWAATGHGAALRVSERAAGGKFSAPRTRSPARIGNYAVAINARGDRVLAWWRGDRIEARVRPAGRRWGAVQLVARARQEPDPGISALVTSTGRIVVAWGTAERLEDAGMDLAFGVAMREPGRGWRAWRLERARDVDVSSGELTVPLVAGDGATYVAWSGARGVMLARVSARGPSVPALVSGGQDRTVLDDAAAGPGRALAMSWRRELGDGSIDTYAAVRGRTGGFSAPERLNWEPVRLVVRSRVAFQPRTGEAVVIGPSGSPERPGLQAFVSAPVTAGRPASAAPAAADTTIATLARPAPVSAYGGRLVWSSFDSMRGVYVLMTRFAGVTSAVPVRPRAVPFDVDLGPDRDGDVIAAYSRCRREPPRREPGLGNVFTQLPNWARGRGCDLYVLDFATGRERRIVSANSPGASEYLPSVWRGRVAFARVYERKPGRAGRRPYLYARSLAGGRRSLRLPAGTRSTGEFCSGRPRRCRPLIEPGPTALDLRGRRLAVGWDSVDEGASSTLYLETIGARRATRTLVSQVSSGGTQAAEIISPTIVGGWLYWTLGLYGHDTGNRLMSHRISTGARAEAQLPPPSEQARDAYVRGAFATAVTGPDVYYLISGRTIPGEPCTPQAPCSVEPRCAEAEPCPLRSTREIVFRPTR